MCRSHANVAANVAAPVLRRRHGSLKTSRSQHTANGNQDVASNQTTKEKSRHIATLLAASKFAAARIARIDTLQV
jgi:hypothetical protein